MSLVLVPKLMIAVMVYYMVVNVTHAQMDTNQMLVGPIVSQEIKNHKHVNYPKNFQMDNVVKQIQHQMHQRLLVLQQEQLQLHQIHALETNTHREEEDVLNVHQDIEQMNKILLVSQVILLFLLVLLPTDVLETNIFKMVDV